MPQLIAAPLASLFLILSLCAFRLEPSDEMGEWIFPTQVIRPQSGFNDCIDDHRLLIRLHVNGQVAINRYSLTVDHLEAASRRMLEYEEGAEVWFLADPDVSVEEVGIALDAIHSGSRKANVFLITMARVREILRPYKGFRYIGVNHPERFPHEPSICLFYDPDLTSLQ